MKRPVYIIGVFVCLCVLSGSAAQGQRKSSRSPDIPEVHLVSSTSGDRLQEGRLVMYYWEEGDKTYRWYGGAFKPGYKIRWPISVSVTHQEGLRFRIDRSLYPDAGLTLEAWPRIREPNWFPRGKKWRWSCYIDDPLAPCHYEPVVEDGRIKWDVVADIPPEASHLYINFQPAWFNNEDLEPTHLQEAAWNFHVLVK